MTLTSPTGICTQIKYRAHPLSGVYVPRDTVDHRGAWESWCGNFGRFLVRARSIASIVGVLLLFQAAATAAVAQDEAMAAEPDARLNPHAAPDACERCHDPVDAGTPAESIPFAHGGIDEACLWCHAEAPHQVDIEAHRRGEEGVPRGKALVPMVFPLLDGKLSCLTCHDEPACSGESHSPTNPRFFRAGPYETLGTFCDSCHGAGTEGDVRFNPHLAMEEQRETTAICQFCHEMVDDRPEDLDQLRAGRVAICHGCHKDTRHTGSQEHLVALDDEMRVRADDGDLPLTSDGEVFCGTCHDPHPPGSKDSAQDRVEYTGQPLFTDPWLWPLLEPVLAERAESLGTDLTPWTLEPRYLRKPLRGNVLCGTCHTPEDTEERRMGELE